MLEFESGKRRAANRAIVRRRILAVIRDHGPVSRIDIIRLSRMRPTTISAVIGQLLKDGLVLEKDKGVSRGGRRPVMIELNPDAKIAVGLQISKRSISAAAVNLRGETVAERQTPISFSKAHLITKTVIQFVREVIRSLKISPRRLAGVGLAATGLVDDRKGVAMVYSNDGSWRQIAFRAKLEKALHTRVRVEHDTRALAMAERWQARGGLEEPMIYVEYADGVAMSFFMNGELYRGADNFAGELGHMVLDPRGMPCDCGQKGCLESLVSGRALAEAINDYYRRTGSPARLNERLAIEDLIKVCQADRGAAAAAAAIAAKHLGQALVNIAHLLNPRRIVIGGILGQALGATLLPLIRRNFNKQAMAPYARATDIVVSRQGQNATAVGAALMMMRTVFDWNNIQIQADK